MSKRKNKNNTKGPLNTGFTVFTRLAPLKTTEVFDTYWKFAAERQCVFLKRLQGRELPWTQDPILSKHRFTNVYRVTDRVSQYLIQNVIYAKHLPDSSQEILFRVLLFKLFNKIETWEMLTSEFGSLTWEDYNFKRYDNALSKTINGGKKIYSAAYIMPSGGSYFGLERKHSNHLKLIEHMVKNRCDERLMSSRRMQDAFEILKGYPSLGDFLAYQLLIDINYSPIINFSESEFVVPGPGAKGGISKCFIDLGGLNLVEVIKFMADRQEEEFERLGIDFKYLCGRKLQLIDCQNIFCEVDKYSRVRHPNIKGDSDRTKIKQMFRASLKPLNLFFPPKWGINDKTIDFITLNSTKTNQKSSL